MTWLGLVLVGIGCTDLAFSLLRRGRVASAVGASTTIVVALLCGVGGRDLALAALAALGVAAWGEAVTYGFARRRPLVPLAVLAAVLAVTLLGTASSVAPSGPLAEWTRASALLHDVAPTTVLVAAGALLVQLSTGNVVVRLVLGATGTTRPSVTGRTDAPASTLKGGRLLGPMERVLILGLGLAGSLGAAGLVIAAKGLLRFPEISAAREPGIHAVTEYFLVGSFVSWLIPLGCLPLVLV